MISRVIGSDCQPPQNSLRLSSYTTAHETPVSAQQTPVTEL
jgi:hypothetical protein